MKQPIKLLLGIAAAASVAGLAFFGWTVSAKDAATFHLANGTDVTPVEVAPDDALTLLDAKVWKFDVGLTGSFPSHSQMTIAMMPLGGKNFDEASQVKYSIRVYGAGSEGVFANPFKGCHSYTAENQVYQSDSLISLMDGTETTTRYGEARLNDVDIMLSIQPSAMTITR